MQAEDIDRHNPQLAYSTSSQQRSLCSVAASTGTTEHLSVLHKERLICLLIDRFRLKWECRRIKNATLFRSIYKRCFPARYNQKQQKYQGFLTRLHYVENEIWTQLSTATTENPYNHSSKKVSMLSMGALETAPPTAAPQFQIPASFKDRSRWLQVHVPDLVKVAKARVFLQVIDEF